MGRKGMIIALLLTALAVCLCAAAAAEVSGDYHYLVREDGTAVITHFSPLSSPDLRSGRFAVPSVIDGYTVTEIGDDAFNTRLSRTSRERSGITLIIPDTVRRIGNRAFSDCVIVENAVIPDSVVSIGDRAFAGCRLSGAVIPDSVSELDGNPFAGCGGLTEIRVSPDHPSLAVIDGVLFSKADQRLVCCPAGLKLTSYAIPQGTRIIGGRAFDSNSHLTEIAIPDSVTAIQDLAFVGCRKLPGITIPDSVAEIGCDPFCQCRAIIEISAGHPYLEMIDGVLFSKPDRRLVHYPVTLDAPVYAVPQGTRIIGAYSFFSSMALSSVTIPDGVVSIEDYAFANSNGLEIDVIPDSVVSIGDYAFRGCMSQTLTLPDHPIRIGDFAFYGCGRLTTVTVSGGGTAWEGTDGFIGEYAFYYCPSLSDVTIPHGISVIGESAFYGDRALTGVTLPDGITEIKDGAFLACADLSSITIPDSVSEIGTSVFDPATKIVLSDDHPYLALEDGILYGKRDRRLIQCVKRRSPDPVAFVIPDGTRIIDDYPCIAGDDLIIPDSVVSIGKFAFTGCRTADLVIPDSVAAIGENAFLYGDMTTLTLPAGVIDIGARSFMECTSLVSVSVADGGNPAATEGRSLVRGYAFAGCTGLTGVTLPDTVVAIGEGAFLDCAALTEVTLPAGLTFIGEHAFHIRNDETGGYRPIPSVTFIVPRGSYAEQYCIDNGFPYTCPDLPD